MRKVNKYDAFMKAKRVIENCINGLSKTAGGFIWKL